MNPPLISVITPTFNSGPKIAATVASVLSQRRDLYEYLVIDGGSTDDTLAHLRAEGPALRYLSEPDEGIYDGMNKGIRLTSGEFLYFLGAGDRLLPGVLEAVAAEIRKLPCEGQTSRPTLLYGNVDWSIFSRPYDERFDRSKLRHRNICHQAIFYQRSVFDRLGFYNTKYRSLADWEFNIRCFNDRGIRKRYISLRIADYEGGGKSTTAPDPAFLRMQLEFLLSDPCAEQGRNLALVLDEAVWRLYEAGSYIPLRWKVTLLKQNCSAKTICLVVCSLCGLSFARFKQILAFGVALKRMIFRQRREHRLQSFPETAEDLAKSDLFTGWWYYSVELMPGLITRGHYPDSFPMLPRILLRNCDLHGTTCLDLGSMEGLMPVLMCRQGAKTVVATDAIDHCREKMAALRYYYEANFEFQQTGLMYELTNKLRKLGRPSFDVINLSGVLYHVFSPLMVLAGVRSLLKRNGLIIVSTNVVVDNAFTMQFNNAGRLQEETNTFWYLSVPTLEYLLRYLKLAPIDCLYISHREIKSSVRYLTDVESGYLSVVCRAKDDLLPSREDDWMRKSAQQSWEYTGLIDWDFCSRQAVTQVPYSSTIEKNLLKDDTGTIDLLRALPTRAIREAQTSSDAHVLRLADIS